MLSFPERADLKFELALVQQSPLNLANFLEVLLVLLLSCAESIASLQSNKKVL